MRNPWTFPFVCWIRDDELQIRQASADVLAALKTAGFHARRRARSGRRQRECVFVQFEPEDRPFFSWTRPGHYTRDPALVALVTWLRDRGVAFQDVLQADASPAGFMRFLQVTGLLGGPFLEIRYDLDAPRSVEPPNRMSRAPGTLGRSSPGY